MITQFDEYIKEEFKRRDNSIVNYLANKLKVTVNYPVVKYIERKIKNLSDEEKLMKIAKISNDLDRIFSPQSVALLGALISGIAFFIPGASKSHITIYIILTVVLLFNSLSKNYRLLAKDYFKKIKDAYIEKYLPENKAKEFDVYGEEDWGDDDEIISNANKIRYDKKYFSFYEDVPLFGLGHRKDVL